MSRDKRPPTIANAIRNTDYEREIARLKRTSGISNSDGIPGPAGPTGPAGPVGPQGPAGVATTYIHTQGALSATWVITHSLNKRPSVTVIDTGDRVILANVHYDNDNQVTVTFDNATSGKVYLN